MCSCNKKKKSTSNIKKNFNKKNLKNITNAYRNGGNTSQISPNVKLTAKQQKDKARAELLRRIKARYKKS